MKRDMDLIRTILQRIEDEPSLKPIQDIKIPEHTEEEIRLHLALLKDAGFIDANIGAPTGAQSIRFATVFRLTWQGYEFLQASRDDTVWKKAKEYVFMPAASWTVSLLVEWLKSEAQQRILGVHGSSSGGTG